MTIVSCLQVFIAQREFESAVNLVFRAQSFCASNSDSPHVRVAAAKLEARTKHLLGVLEVLKPSMICCMCTDFVRQSALLAHNGQGPKPRVSVTSPQSGSECGECTLEVLTHSPFTLALSVALKAELATDKSAQAGPRAARRAVQLLVKLRRSSRACDLFLQHRRAILHAAMK